VGVFDPPGNVDVDLPDLPLKYGPDTTSRFEVIEFKVNDFFGSKFFYMAKVRVE